MVRRGWVRTVQPTTLRRGSLRALLLTSTACALLAPLLPAQAGTLSASALPTGGSVASGNASISQSGSRLVVAQSSQQAILNWQSFNIGSQAEVDFFQPSSSAIALNRVTFGNASTILGKLDANGRVILINSAGIVFGGGAQVNVGGMIASTLDIKDSDFLAGNLAFQRNGAAGSISNFGSLTAADGGNISLLAPQINNQGVITARLGSVVLAGGDAVTLNFPGSGGVGVKVDAATVKTQIDQGGMIVASGGQVVLTAKAANAVLGGVINDGGAIQANSLTSQGGEITLDATGPITLAGAKLDASGATGGGSITVGGWQTASVAVDAASSLDASATGQGNGGSISVIGGNAQVAGTLKARGGAAGGHGGTVETSGHALAIGGARVDTLAANGKAGNWLLDPYDLTVDATAATAIDNALATSNVTLLTKVDGASGFGNANAAGGGDISINSALAWSANTTLTLDAYRSVLVNANVTATGNSAGLVVKYNDGGTGGTFQVGNAVTGNTSSVTLAGANAGLTINGHAYTLIHSAAALQNIGTTGYYALAGNVDASGITNFQPIGFTSGANATPTQFTGTLEGLGNTVSNLIINNASASNLGLFSSVGASGVVRNLGLLNATITGGSGVSHIGSLAGTNAGTIANVYATGAEAEGYNVYDIGGLVGANSGLIFNSNSDVYVSAQSQSHDIGGLSGINNGGTISNSSATGVVVGDDRSYNIGGLTGENFGGTILSSGATGAVSVSAMTYNVGGLVGENSGLISNSNASGTVSAGFSQFDIGSATYAIGGLVGNNGITGTAGYRFVGSILNSYASGAVSGGSAAFGIGGLVGTNSGLISNSHASGSVNGGTVAFYIGGLVGANEYDTNGTASAIGTITNSYATGAVTGGDGGDGIGGLVGATYGGTISSSYATGAVTGGSGADGVGGLVGGNTGLVSNSYATGSVSAGIDSSEIGGLVGANSSTNVSGFSATGTITGGYASGTVTGSDGAYDIGGLAGSNSGTLITNSYATGAVSGSGSNADLGGLVGENGGGSGTITSSYATGTVTGGNYASYVGGLVGGNSGLISKSFASGAVSGGVYTKEIGGLVGGTGLTTATGYSYVGSVIGSYAFGAVSGGPSSYGVGGLAGGNSGLISNSYATGSVYGDEGTQGIGGLVGGNMSQTNGSVTSVGSIGNSYASGAVSGSIYGVSYIGGLVGANQGKVTGSYWDTTTTGRPSGNGVNTGTFSAVGLNDTAMKLKSSFVGWDFTNTWGITNGATYPTLLGVAKPKVTWSIGDSTMTYGSASTLGTLSLNGVSSADSLYVSASIVLVNAAGQQVVFGSTLAAGTYSEEVVGLSGASAYLYTLSNVGSTVGTLTVNPKTLTWSVANASSTYGTPATLGTATLTGIVGNDAVGGIVSATNAAIPSATTAVGTYTETVTGLSGAAAGNYILAGGGNTTGTLTINPKALTIAASSAGKTYGSTAPLTFTSSGLVNGDNIGSVVETSAGAAAVAGVGSYGVNISGASGSGLSNYTITYAPGTLTVTPKALTITADNAAKTYGGSGGVGANAFTTSGLVNGDNVGTVSESSAGTSATAGVGSYAINASAASGSGLSNYAISYVSGTLTINPKVLTWSIGNATSTYGTQATPTIQLSGLVNGDSVGGVAGVSNGISLVPLAPSLGVGHYTELLYSLSGAAAANYTFTSAGSTRGTLTVNPKTLTWSVANTSSTYGTTATAGQATLNGLVGTDRVGTVVTTTNGSGGTVTLAAQTNAGSYTEKVTGLTGAAAANYVLAGGGSAGTLTINPKTLTWSVNDSVVSTYGNAATLSTASLSGIVGRDAVRAVVNATNGSGQVIALNSSTSVGTYTETVTGLTGAAAANYRLAAAPTSGVPRTLTIDPRRVTVSLPNVTSSAASASAAVQNDPVIKGLLPSDQGGVTVNLVTYSNTAATGTPVTVGAATPAGKYTMLVTGLSGADAGDYIIASSLPRAALTIPAPVSSYWW